MIAFDRQVDDDLLKLCLIPKNGGASIWTSSLAARVAPPLR
ncbi:MAG: hypothetical protein WBX25_21565 [Rhodomicrobium sp.]